MGILDWLSGSKRVYVDAKILNIHDSTLPRVAFAGYLIDGTDEHHEKPVEATETDDVEIEATLFAMENLVGKFRRLVVVCDHESVVSEAKRELVKNSSPLLARLREMLHKNPSVHLEPLKTNPEHKYLTEYVNRVTGKTEHS
jgi:hypothetical protein